MKVLAFTFAVLIVGAFFSTPVSAAPNVCVSVNGDTKIQQGTADCDTHPGGNIAVATGDISYAEAGPGDKNTAIAAGGSVAGAGKGDNNTAIATGGSVALATATDGYGCTALATSGDTVTCP